MEIHGTSWIHNDPPYHGNAHRPGAIEVDVRGAFPHVQGNTWAGFGGAPITTM